MVLQPACSLHTDFSKCIAGRLVHLKHLQTHVDLTDTKALAYVKSVALVFGLADHFSLGQSSC